MTTHRTKQDGPDQNKEERLVDFRLVDHKKRSMGTKIVTWEADFVGATDNDTFWDTITVGHKFAFYGQVTRNGKEYGASSPWQYFHTDLQRGMYIDRYLDGAIYRASKIGTPLPGTTASDTRSNLQPPMFERPTRKEEKLARKAARDAKVIADIAALEPLVQALLNDAGLMEYLKAHPWPLVIPGPPSMDYTAYEHLVVRATKSIHYALAQHDKANELNELKFMYDALREQRKRRSMGMAPETQRS